MDTELFKEWFQAFAQHAGLTLHVENLYGTNNHHIVESCFTGLARALREAIQIDPRKADAVPSTKGSLCTDRPAPPPTAKGHGRIPRPGGVTTMTVALIDYGSGNRRSASKSPASARAQSGDSGDQ